MRSKILLLTFIIILFSISMTMADWSKVDENVNVPWYGMAKCFSTAVWDQGTRYIYAANGINRMFYSTDDGETWNGCDEENTSHITAILADPYNEHYVYIAREDPNNPTINGFWKSINRGLNFTQENGDENNCGQYLLTNVKITSIGAKPLYDDPYTVDSVIVTCRVDNYLGEGNVLRYSSHPQDDPMCWYLDTEFSNYYAWDPYWGYEWMSMSAYAANFNDLSQTYVGTRRRPMPPIFPSSIPGIYRYLGDSYTDLLVGRNPLGSDYYYDGVNYFKFSDGNITTWPPLALVGTVNWYYGYYYPTYNEIYYQNPDDRNEWLLLTKTPGGESNMWEYGNADYFPDMAPIALPNTEGLDFLLFLTCSKEYESGSPAKSGIYRWTQNSDWENLTSLPTTYFKSGRGLLAYQTPQGGINVLWGANDSPNDEYGKTTYGAVYRDSVDPNNPSEVVGWHEVNKHMNTLKSRELCILDSQFVVAGLTENPNWPYAFNHWLISCSDDNCGHWTSKRGDTIDFSQGDEIRDLKYARGGNWSEIVYAAPVNGIGYHYDTIYVSTNQGRGWDPQFGFDENHPDFRVWNIANYHTRFYASLTGRPFVVSHKAGVRGWSEFGEWDEQNWGEARGIDAGFHGVDDGDTINIVLVGTQYDGIKSSKDDGNPNWGSAGLNGGSYTDVDLVKGYYTEDSYVVLAKVKQNGNWHLMRGISGPPITWSNLDEEIPATRRNIQSIEFDSDKPHVVVLSTLDASNNGYCYLSINGGVNWNIFNEGLGANFGRVKDVAFWHSSSQLYYAEAVYLATDKGLYKWPIIFPDPVIDSDTEWTNDYPIFITQDILIDTGATLTIDPGTQIYFSPKYESSSKSRTRGPKITVKGELLVSGTSGSPIEFKPWMNPDSAGNDEWSGIIVSGTGGAEINYALISNASTGLSAKLGAGIVVENSTINKCKYDGVYADSDAAVVMNSCTIEDIGYCGVKNLGAVSKIDSCSLTNCKRYGVYISYTDSSFKDSSTVSHSTIQYSIISDPDSSQYAISVSGLSMTRITNNNLRGYGQGGIKLNMCNIKIDSTTVKKSVYYGIYAYKASPIIGYCTFDSILSNTSMGIFADGGSYPKVRYTQFKHLREGVSAHEANLPDLGDSTDFGYNDFEGCVNRYIAHADHTPPYPLLSAVGNYYGEDGPDTTKFSYRPLINYCPGITTDPFPKIGIPVEQPTNYTLSTNYPNPFNPKTTIKFNLISGGQTKLEVYNIIGQKINTLVESYLAAGEYSFTWNGCDYGGNPVASGVYIYRIESEGFTQTKTMTLLK
jgi:hypothetical protein